MKLKKILETLMDKDVDYYNDLEGKRLKTNIYKNPSGSELKKLLREAGGRLRAVKTINGKIYTTDEQEESNIIHETLVVLLSKEDYITNEFNNSWWRDEDSINHFLCIENDGKGWRIGESYHLLFKNEDFPKRVKEKYKNVRVKNE